MTDRPILFSSPMIRALLDGRKTQTRRVLKLNGARPAFCGGRGDLDDPTCWGWEDTNHGDWITLEKDPGQRMGWRDWVGALRAGDRLWVREAHWFTEEGDCVPVAGNEEASADERKRAPMHMPRWSSRLTLTVTDVRVQRLQDISEADSLAEGVGTLTCSVPAMGKSITARDDFRDLWDSLNEPRGSGWDNNPWIVAYTFTVERKNIDEKAS